MAPTPKLSCRATTSMHGPSRLSRASSSSSCDGMPPIAADKELQALMSDERKILSAADESQALTKVTDELRSSSQLARRADDGHQFQASAFNEGAAGLNNELPLLSIDDLLEVPTSEADAAAVAQLFSDEEVKAILSAGQPRRTPHPGSAPRSDGANKKKRKRRPPPPLPSPRSSAERAAKRACKKADEHALLRVRARQKETAIRILLRDFKPSRGGQTVLRCQCAELAAVDGGSSFRSCCSLHQHAAPAGGDDDEWAREVRRRVPLAAGPGEVVVPKLSERDSIAAVTRYARWRHSVWMPTRFYLQHGSA